MSPQQKDALKRIAGLLAVLLPALGWAVTSSATVMDTRYVHQTEYARHVIVDSIRQSLTNQKLDELLLRVEQIQCGNKIASGCR